MRRFANAFVRSLVATLAILILVSGMAIGIASARAATRDTTTIKIKAFAFKPKKINVTAGTKVRWINKDEIVHTVTARDDRFDAALDGKGSRFDVTFREPGRYAYFCARHPGMRGAIVVE